MQLLSRVFLQIVFASALFAVLFSAQPAAAISADEAWGSYWGGDRDVTETSAAIGTNTGLSNADPRAIAARVINVVLGFLGIIAVIIIVAAGFIWMTAAGDEGKIETAKKMMSAGVIGLVIVLAAFGIAQFVVNALVEATTA